MQEISPLDAIAQQLDTLSLEHLLKVRVRIDALIEEKLSLSKKGSGAGKSLLVLSLLKEFEAVQFKKADEEDESLEGVIKLVDEWMSDESGYDEETYPQIEAALN